MKKSFIKLSVLFALFSCTETEPVADPKVLMDADTGNDGLEK